MQSSFRKDVYITLITVCLQSYLLTAAQEKIPARNVMDVHVQDFTANIHPESFHSSTTECIQFPHALTTQNIQRFWSVCSGTACHLYQWQSSSPLYSQLSPVSHQLCPPPSRDLFMSCDLYMSMNCLISSPLSGAHTGTYHQSQRTCHQLHSRQLYSLNHPGDCIAPRNKSMVHYVLLHKRQSPTSNGFTLPLKITYYSKMLLH